MRTLVPTGTRCLFIRSKCGNYIACDAVESVKARFVDQTVTSHYDIMIVGGSLVEHVTQLDYKDLPSGTRFTLPQLADKVAEMLAVATRRTDFPASIARIEHIVFAAKRVLFDQTHLEGDVMPEELEGE